MRPVLALLLWLFSGCVTTLGTDSTDRDFEEFPRNFAAIQLITIRQHTQSRTVLANLVRRDNQFEVTFLEPTLQVPLLTLESVDVAVPVHSTYYISERLPFDEQEMMDAIRGVYTSGGRDLTRFTVKLQKIRAFDSCSFPSQIELRPKTHAATVASSIPADLTIETRELECQTK